MIVDVFYRHNYADVNLQRAGGGERERKSVIVDFFNRHAYIMLMSARAKEKQDVILT